MIGTSYTDLNYSPTMTLRGIINPPTTQSVGPITFQQKDSNGYVVQEYKNSYMFTASPGTLILLNNSPIVTSTVLAANVDMSINMQTAHAIDANSWIYLTIPDTVLVLLNPASPL